MNEIRESNNEIEKMVDVIDEIGDKTKIIDEIAFQTKILSLNASVEAERAGEYGKGFSVVAQEVSNLAQLSAQAAKEISDIVKSSIKSAQELSKNNQQKVLKGDALVKNTSSTLEVISDDLGKVIGSAEHILTASKDQSQGISQVNEAVSQLNQATQQTAGLADSASKSARELEHQSDLLKNSVNGLLRIVGVQELKIRNRESKHDSKIVAFSDPSQFQKQNELKKAAGDQMGGWDDF